MKANKRVLCSHTLRPSYSQHFLLQMCTYHDEEVERRKVLDLTKRKIYNDSLCDDGKWIVLKVSKRKMYFSIDLLLRLHGFIISSSIKAKGSTGGAKKIVRLMRSPLLLLTN